MAWEVQLALTWNGSRTASFFVHTRVYLLTETTFNVHRCSHLTELCWVMPPRWHRRLCPSRRFRQRAVRQGVAYPAPPVTLGRSVVHPRQVLSIRRVVPRRDTREAGRTGVRHLQWRHPVCCAVFSFLALAGEVRWDCLFIVPLLGDVCLARLISLLVYLKYRHANVCVYYVLRFSS